MRNQQLNSSRFSTAARRGRQNRGVSRLLANPYVLVAPAIVLASLFTLYPVIFSVVVSLCKWDILRGTISWKGLSNYQYIFSDPDFRIALRNSLVYMIFTVLFSIVLSFLSALFLNRNRWTHNLVQSIVFSPHIVAMVSISILWQWLMDVEIGLLNYLITRLGMEPLLWLKGEGTALLSVIIVSVWNSIGYNTIILIAGLQSIPREIYEAARLDKSRKLTTMLKITVPLLSPTLFFLVVTGMIGSFKAFEIVRLLTQGGPMGRTNMLVYYIYQQGFQFLHVGDAMAATVVLLAILGVISFLNFRFLGDKVHYQ